MSKQDIDCEWNEEGTLVCVVVGSNRVRRNRGESYQVFAMKVVSALVIADDAKEPGSAVGDEIVEGLGEFAESLKEKPAETLGQKLVARLKRLDEVLEVMPWLDGVPWVSVEKRLPDVDRWVLIGWDGTNGPSRQVGNGRYCRRVTSDDCRGWEWWYKGASGMENVEGMYPTHWMPLPEGPKAEKPV